MADMKALFTERFDAARAALTQGDEPAAAESLHWAIVAARSDPSLRRELASALFHLGKLSRKFGRAGETEAEALLTEALAISDEIFGKENAALVPLLNELTRLHVHLSQHARAEHALGRLLVIARVKGDENADEAIALAGLAVVKRKLGDEAAAEALYRDALRIREKVLGPNHMVTVATLEQLSETCAARNNFAEALFLLQRALLTREAAMGPGHETVRVAKSRVAELELQVAIRADAEAVAASRAARGPIPTPAFIKRAPEPAKSPSTAVPTPPDSEELEFLGEPEPKVPRPAPLPRERAKTPAVAAAVAAASLMASPLRTPAASQVVIPPPESAHPSGTVAGSESGAALRDVALADVTHYDVASSAVASGDIASIESDFGPEESALAAVHADSPEPAPRKRTILYAGIGVAAAAVIASAAVMLRAPKAGGGKPGTPEKTVAQQSAAVVPVTTTGTPTKGGFTVPGTAALVSAERADSPRSASVTPVPSAPAGKPEQHATESAAPELKAPKIQIHVAPVNIPSIPAANVDSIVRSSTERQRVADTAPTATAAVVPQPMSAADADEAVTAPKIVGRAPAPRYPDALLRSTKSDGEVVVRFKVTELGRVDVSTLIVVRSDHDLFTAAVRDILGDFRFEPARTRASKPVAAWVTAPFLFKAKK